MNSYSFCSFVSGFDRVSSPITFNSIASPEWKVNTFFKVFLNFKIASGAVPVSFKAAAGNLLGHPWERLVGDTRSSPPSLAMIFSVVPALTSIILPYTGPRVN